MTHAGQKTGMDRVSCFVSMTQADQKTGTDGIMIDGVMLDLNDTRRLEDWDRWYPDRWYYAGSQ